MLFLVFHVIFNYLNFLDYKNDVTFNEKYR